MGIRHQVIGVFCVGLLVPVAALAQPDLTGRSWTRWDQGWQAAPFFIVTGKAFGIGRRYPIINRYEPNA